MHPAKSLIHYARYLKRFGMVQGNKVFYSNFLSNKSLTSVRIPGLSHKVFFRKDSSDAACFNQVFLGLDYDFEINSKPQFIIDCGANVGYTSLFFQKKYPGAHIIAVEPEPTNFEMLQMNTKLYSNIDCLNYGIWNKNVNLKVTEESKLIGSWGLTVTETEEEDNVIKSITISEVMKLFGKNEIDILKIDIEGSEFEVFTSNYEEWLPQTKVIMIELHDRLRKGCSKAFFNALSEYDFSLHQYFTGEILMCIRNNGPLSPEGGT
ncbi:MAG: FkbM family methyltransferase [Flavisolibacter sp.]|jgi:FkbM family methyltransferase